MNIDPRTGLAAIGVTGALAIGILGAGVVMAQEGDGSPPAESTSSVDGDTRPFHRPHRLGVKGAAALFQASGLDRPVFIEGFEQGLTIGQVLEQEGLDPAAVVADALAGAQERLDQAVADGKIEEDRAAEMAENLETALTDLLDITPDLDAHPRGRGHFRDHARRHFGGNIAEALGLTPQELREELSDGDTIAEVAEALGIDVQDVIDAALAPLFERIDEAVANGRLTEEEAAEKKANATERITELINNGPPVRIDRGTATGDTAP